MQSLSGPNSQCIPKPEADTILSMSCKEPPYNVEPRFACNNVSQLTAILV